MPLHPAAPRQLNSAAPRAAPAERIATSTTTRWLDAAQSHNARALGELYAENAVLMPPTDETIVGRAPIARYLADGPGAASLRGYTVDIVGCDLSGDTLEIAGVWGVDEAHLDPRTGLRTGNVMRVANRQPDGSWTLKYEIWN
ncbi:MAG: YybH family protein [Gammaproteobacteria bacterium]